MAEFMLVFAALCLVTAIHIRIRDLGEEERDGGEKILRRLASQDYRAGRNCKDCFYFPCPWMNNCPFKQRKGE